MGLDPLPGTGVPEDMAGEGDLPATLLLCAPAETSAGVPAGRASGSYLGYELGRVLAQGLVVGLLFLGVGTAVQGQSAPVLRAALVVGSGAAALGTTALYSWLTVRSTQHA